MSKQITNGSSNNSSAMVAASSSSSLSSLDAQAAARGLGPSTSTSLLAGSRRKIHTSFPSSGVDMVEEYDVDSGALMLRRMRTKSSMGAWGEWKYEVGEEVAMMKPKPEAIIESNANPLFLRLDTSTHFQFRIRNLPYAYATYIVSIDPASDEIVLRTTNKKYYKRMNIPDLRSGRSGGADQGKLDEKYLSYKHANNTLIISYVKPPFILALDSRNALDIARLGSGTSASSQGGSTDANGQKLLAGNAIPVASSPAQGLLASIQRERRETEEAAQAHAQSSATNIVTSNANSSGITTVGGAGASKSKAGNGAAAGGRDEFGSGLNGLKGLSGKDGECKQQ